MFHPATFPQSTPPFLLFPQLLTIHGGVVVGSHPGLSTEQLGISVCTLLKRALIEGPSPITEITTHTPKTMSPTMSAYSVIACPSSALRNRLSTALIACSSVRRASLDTSNPEPDSHSAEVSLLQSEFY